MEVVEYYANQSYFQALANAEGVDPSNGVATKFVDNNGWTTQWQTIHQAEKKYDGKDETSCDSCQSFSLWNNTVNIKMPEVEKAYDDTDSSDNEKAWRVENAGISEADILSPLDPETTKPIFPGGFAGKCSEGQMWQYDNPDGSGDPQWMCSGDIPWDQPVMLPETNGGFIALIIPHTNLMTGDELVSQGWSIFESYPQASSNRDELGSLKTLKATCWVGDLNDDPQELPDSKVISDNVDISDSGSPFGIYGEVDKAPNSEYSCNWEYVTTTGEVISNVGTPVPMQEGDTTLENMDQDFVDWKSDHLTNINGLETTYSSLSDLRGNTSEWNLVEIQ
ncbi:hypothetical protein ACFR99_01660 [Haloarchaeobius amylolyticus]|uniref:Uncharacterized protein n=1 Tax=Haloarchaeobius amylolyticus TaxID=1198296 RepID=A0ABD6BCN5_9EURY